MKHDELQKLFRDFLEQCIWLQCCYNTYRQLYESDESTDRILKESALLFFQDMNIILIDYIFLKICSITDPEESFGHKNLTSNAIDSELQKHDLLTSEIQRLSSGLMHYRCRIVGAKNQLISHLDRDVIRAGIAIGGHSKQEVIDFFKCLHDYTDAVGIALDVGPLDYTATPGPGDAIDLIRILKQKVSLSS